MKKVIIFFYFFIPFHIICQEKMLSSIGFNLNSYYYFPEKDFKNIYNYSFSFLTSNRIKKEGYSIGIEYSIKIFKYPSSYYLEKINLRSIKFPCIFDFIAISRDKFFTTIFNGLVFNHVIDYFYEVNYNSVSPLKIRSLVVDKRVGIIIISGVTLSRMLSDRWKFNISFFANYTLLSEYYSIYIVPRDYSKPFYKIFIDLPVKKKYIGFNLGIEYLLHQRTIKSN